MSQEQPDNNTEAPTDIGQRLRAERERLKMTQSAFGTVGGVRKGAQGMYESGERSPDAHYLEGVAQIGVDVQYVITGQRSTHSLGPAEQKLLALFWGASPEVKAATLGGLEAAAEASQSAKRIWELL